MPPPAITPEQISDYAPKVRQRVVRVDANVIAYFGDLFASLRQGLTGDPAKTVRKARSDTGAAQNRS